MFNQELHEQHMKTILKELFSSEIWKYLAFKWGTLTYFVHGLDRFSTDLDLDILDISKEQEIIQKVKEVLLRLGDVKNETLGKTIHRWIFRYNTDSMNIKVELNKRVRENNNYELQTIDWEKILCMSPDCIFSNKLVALSERLYNRDLYDVWYFLGENFELNEKLINERTGQTIDTFVENLLEQFPTYFQENSILEGLGEVLTEKQKIRAKKFLLDETIFRLKKKTNKTEIIEKFKSWYITKSLLVEFATTPKLARRHIHDKKGVYKDINEALYWAMDWLAVGQATEDMVLQLYKNKEIATVDTSKINFSNWHKSYHELTQTTISNKPEVLYQGSFVVNDLFTKSDLLVLNEEWKYDLVEVKSKNSIRKKTKAEPLLEDLQYDVSFQSYILKQVLGDLFSGKSYLAYLNKEYVKDGEINVNGLLVLDDVSDELLSDETIEHTVALIRKNLQLEQDEFEKLYPYDGSDYMTYFWKPKPKDSIRSIPRIGKKVLNFYPNKTKLEDFTEEDILSLYNNKGEKTKTSNFVELRKQAETVINKEAINERFKNELKYPLYFYDYETISRPIPLFEGTSPRQQVITQYSLHKIDEDWTITHKEAIIWHGETSNKKVIDQLIQDFEDGNWTYIVRYKGFENSRNNELTKMEMYTKYKNILERVNNNTFDLMELFSKQLYFDRRFQGSASIKKVLPVLTDISYENMNVANGWIATDLLRQIAQWEISKEEAKKGTIDLLEYCKQDTWAMVRIWEEVKKNNKFITK